MIEVMWADGGTYEFSEVASPYGKAMQLGVDLNELLHTDPATGETQLNELAGAATQEIEAADGAAGIFYRVFGACPAECTPMQFGGHYLEVDRAILNTITKGIKTIVFIEGEDIYFDFVSDLPCDAMGWDEAINTLTLAEARTMRPGLYALTSPEAEIKIRQGVTV
ncbi:MAG: hypothetical protein K8R88_15020 [Armatimonadetes bacterium]|nr:hypothetical protein [Armatimonadota bacterium]